MPIALPSASDGISFEQLKTIASDKQCEVKFENVKVPKANVLGEVGKGWELVDRIGKKATVIECAYLVGLAQKDFEISVQYAKDRIQFGAPIGKYQGVKHPLAEMYVDVETSRSLLYYAAWCVGEKPEDLPLATARAKAYSSEAFTRIGTDGVQLHGAIGFTAEYDIQLYLKRSKWALPAFGDAEFHYERIASLGGY